MFRAALYGEKTASSWPETRARTCDMPAKNTRPITITPASARRAASVTPSAMTVRHTATNTTRPYPASTAGDTRIRGFQPATTGNMSTVVHPASTAHAPVTARAAAAHLPAANRHRPGTAARLIPSSPDRNSAPPRQRAEHRQHDHEREHESH